MIRLVDCQEVAKLLGVSPEIILAVARVESGSDINQFLFEPHVFSRLTGHHYDSTHPHVSYPIWDRKKYPTTKLGRQLQFENAIMLDALKAYESASWGLFQIMGFNYEVLGYSSALSMATDLKASTVANMRAFGDIIKYMNLVKILQNKKWDKFARVYNGPGFKSNNYDIKIEAAYAGILKEESGKANA